jgi:hypothetical protein
VTAGLAETPDLALPNWPQKPYSEMLTFPLEPTLVESLGLDAARAIDFFLCAFYQGLVTLGVIEQGHPQGH